MKYLIIFFTAINSFASLECVSYRDGIQENIPRFTSDLEDKEYLQITSPINDNSVKITHFGRHGNQYTYQATQISSPKQRNISLGNVSIGDYSSENDFQIQFSLRNGQIFMTSNEFLESLYICGVVTNNQFSREIE